MVSIAALRKLRPLGPLGGQPRSVVTRANRRWVPFSPSALDSIDGDDGDLYSEPGYVPPNIDRLFTRERWSRHKSTDRYWRHLLGIFSSRTVERLARPLLGLTVATSAICVLENSATTHMIAGQTFAWITPFTLPSFPFSVLSTALSLLMVFRTDKSYSRWQEAVDTWTLARQHAIDLVVYSSNWIADPSLRRALFRWNIAYWQSLTLHIRGAGEGLEEVLGNVMTPSEMDALQAVKGHPQFCLQVLLELVERANELQPNDVRQAKMVSHINVMGSLLVCAQKLVKYPLPLSYTRHTSRFMMLFLFLMPLALWNSLLWMSIPTTIGVAFLLLGIEEIGVQIEEPFAVLPVYEMANEMCDSLAKVDANHDNVKSLVREVFAPVTHVK